MERRGATHWSFASISQKAFAHFRLAARCGRAKKIIDLSMRKYAARREDAVRASDEFISSREDILYRRKSGVD